MELAGRVTCLELRRECSSGLPCVDGRVSEASEEMASRPKTKLHTAFSPLPHVRIYRTVHASTDGTRDEETDPSWKCTAEAMEARGVLGASRAMCIHTTICPAPWSSTPHRPPSVARSRIAARRLSLNQPPWGAVRVVLGIGVWIEGWVGRVCP
jgi:hypothetical protein